MQYLLFKEIKVLFDAGALSDPIAERIDFSGAIFFVLTYAIRDNGRCALATTREPQHPQQIKDLKTCAKSMQDIGFKSFTVIL